MLKKKIFVIGPLVPYTGGVAQSNTVLCNNLAQNNDVTAISYSLMYPKFLYPGKKQIDGEYLKKTKFKQEFILNTINPLSWIKICLMVGKQKPDWLVFQWWHTYFFPSYFFITIFSKLFYRAKINVVCHHAFFPNDVSKSKSSLMTRLVHFPLTKLFFSVSTHLAILSQKNCQLIKKILPKTPSDFVIENSFSFLMKPAVLKSSARKSLGLSNKKILLSFGAVRTYKGLEDLIEALSIISKKHDDYFLLVAGAFWVPVKKYEELAKFFGVFDRIRFVDKYISDNEVPLYFCSSDLVILSHRTASQSAIPQLAFDYNVPMIATSVGENKVVIDDAKTGFIIPPRNPKEMAKKVELFFGKNLSKSFVSAMQSKRKILDWSEEKERFFFGEY